MDAPRKRDGGNVDARRPSSRALTLSTRGVTQIDQMALDQLVRILFAAYAMLEAHVDNRHHREPDTFRTPRMADRISRSLSRLIEASPQRRVKRNLS